MLRRGEIRDLGNLVARRFGPRRMRKTWPTYMAELLVPEGAADHFHFERLGYATIRGWLEEASLAVDERLVRDDNKAYIRARPV